MQTNNTETNVEKASTKLSKETVQALRSKASIRTNITAGKPIGWGGGAAH
jgi:hypothetical protein